MGKDGHEAVFRACFELGKPGIARDFFQPRHLGEKIGASGFAFYLSSLIQPLQTFTEDVLGALERAVQAKVFTSDEMGMCLRMILRRVRKSPRQRRSLVSRIWAFSAANGIPLGDEGEVSVLKGLRGERGEDKEDIYPTVLARLEHRRAQGTLGVEGWNFLIRIRSEGENVESVKELWEGMRSAGVEPNEQTLLAMHRAEIRSLVDQKGISHLPTLFLDRLTRLEIELGIESGVSFGEQTIRRLNRLIDSDPVLTEREKRDLVYGCYENAVRAGWKVTLPIAHTVIHRLARADAETEAEGEEKRLIDTRIGNVRLDWLALQDEGGREVGTPEGMSLAERDRAIAGVYDTCLSRLLTPIAPPKGVVPESIALLDEMRTRGFIFPRPTMRRWIAQLMPLAQHHQEAFRVYSYVRALAPSVLRKEDYVQIIQLFVGLGLPRSPWPLPKLTFEFLRDMRDEGVRVDGKVYTVMINEYTRYLRRRRKERGLANTGAGEMMGEKDQRIANQVGQAIERTHAMVKLDSFLDLDVPLMTALMDAYNQLQAWPETFTMWNEIIGHYRLERESGEMDTKEKIAYRPALSVVLDACGFCGNLARGRKIWDWAEGRDMIRPSWGNWKSWVECLCRCDEVEEACEVVAGLLRRSENEEGGDSTASLTLRGKNGEVDEAEELVMLEMLVRFSWRREEDWRIVRKMIEVEFPERYEALKASGVINKR
jgi:pentatricopeptide repeat protein